MGTIQSYRDLHVWQKSVDFTIEIYRITETFPSAERYGLTNQMRRAAVSIPSNIAEGHTRSRREYGRFLSIALGFLAELETQIEIARRINYLSKESAQELVQKLAAIGKQLNVLHQKIKG